MPGDVIYTLLSHNNKLVMEENERKEIQENQLIGTSSQLRHEHIKINERKEQLFREIGAGDCNNSMREMDTLPLRTDILRARFQSKIDEALIGENKLTTTALVERPPLPSKEQFEKRKQRFLNEAQVDRPDDGGAPENRYYVGFRNSAESDSKDRSLMVRLPDYNKTNNANDEIDKSVNSDNIAPVGQLQEHPDDVVSTPLEDETDSKYENVVEKDDDCLVNCIYYTQQFCDCTIL